MVTEAVLKLVGYGPKSYFLLGWNRFDFFLVMSSYIGYASNMPSFTTLLRVFRIMRVLRLIRGSKAMFQLLNTLFMSLPSMVNVGAILFLLYFVYAIGTCRNCPRDHV